MARKVGNRIDTMRCAKAKAASLVIGLLSLLTYFLAQSRGDDLALRARMQEALQCFALHDAELTREALLARAGLLSNYDSLSTAIHNLSGDLDTLRRQSGVSPRAESEFRSLIETLAGSVDEKLTLIEYFKSDNALLRNSLLYFVHAAESAFSLGDRNAAVTAEIGALSRSVLKLTLTPTPTSAEEIRTLLARLTPAPPAVQARLQDLAAHSRLIAALLLQVDKELRLISATPTGAHARALQDAALRYSSKAEAHAQVHTVLLYFTALILLGYLCYQFVLLRDNAAVLARTNGELKWKMAETKRLHEANRQKELLLIQANKMTTLGILVSGVAHEINSPNQLVLTACAVLTKAWNDVVRILDKVQREHGDFTLAGLAYREMRHTVAALVQDVHGGALRIGRIVADLKGFVRPVSTDAPRPFQLNDAVQQAARLLAHLIRRRRAELRKELAADLPLLCGNLQQVEQIVINVLVNALEALPSRGGIVSISTFFDAREQAVVLEVRDEGVGIPGDHLERLCDPFFTTKQETGGTGLGLAISRSLALAHNGVLLFDSTPGKGTRVLAKFRCVHGPNVS